MDDWEEQADWKASFGFLCYKTGLFGVNELIHM
jgi:hypothetical protein